MPMDCITRSPACQLTRATAASFQVPCGIYDDKAVFNKMLQDTSTIRKGVCSQLAPRRRNPV